MPSKKLVLDSEGVSQTCDMCGKDLRLICSYTWLLQNEKPANRRFCSIECLLAYERGIPISEVKAFMEKWREIHE